MTIKYQLSDKRGDAILLAAVEEDDPVLAEEQFAQAVALAGLSQAYESFSQPAANFSRPTTTGQAVVNAQPLTQPQVPAAAAPSCQHGVKVHKSGVSAKGPWQAWACPARSSDPTRCGFDFIR